MDLHTISNNQLLQEEKAFYSRYKNSIKESIKNCNSKNYSQCFDIEIQMFNQWFMRKEEIENRALNKKRIQRK